MKNYIILSVAIIMMALSGQLCAQVKIASGVKVNLSSDGYLMVGEALSIAAGGELSIAGKSTIAGTVTNTGGSSALVVKSTNTYNASLIQTSSVVNARVQRFMSVGDYHFVASPVVSQAISPEFINTSSNPLSTGVDFYKFDEPNNLWCNIKDASGNLNSTFETEFAVSRGYAVAYNDNDYTKNFSGELNTNTQAINLTRTSGTGNEGWNLVGNPFSSTIAVNSNADAINNFLSDNAMALDDSFVGIYLWDGSDYTTINEVNSATFLNPTQAFFVKAASNNEILTFNHGIQKHADATASTEFYKTSNQTAIFSMGVTGPLGDYNEITFAFISGKTNGLDPGYDSQKFKGNANLALYSRLVSDGSGEYVIQTLPELENGVIPIVELGLDCWQPGTYTFHNFVRENLDSTVDIFLVDNSNNTWTNTATIPNYSFYLTQTGQYSNRFFINFESFITNSDELEADRGIKIYTSSKTLFVQNQTNGDIEGRLHLINMAGQEVITYNCSVASHGRGTFYPNLAPGIYQISYQINNGIVSQKVVLGM